MAQAITKDTIDTIKNPALKRYAQLYIDIEEDFRTQVAAFGLPFAQEDGEGVFGLRVQKLAAAGVECSNDCKSIHRGWISPSCVTCRKGVGTVTFLISVQCPRNCFFCFNPNQVDYDRLLHETKDVIAEIDEYHAQGIVLNDVALTGGEPLTHKQETLAFFRHARELYPDARTRLYTSGAYLDEEMLAALKDAGLDEIRFSVKLDEGEAVRAQLLDLMKLSHDYIQDVMVEMPVMPDGVQDMKGLLRELDAAGVTGINLLELCYPLHNAEEFARRGYAIKKTPYRVLYDYWYAGGLPIAGSEEACLDVMQYAVDEGLALGVHYCSLENKFTGQIYTQDKAFAARFGHCAMSPRDHFLKCAKVFGSRAEVARDALIAHGCNAFEFDAEEQELAFLPEYLGVLAKVIPDEEMALSYNVAQPSEQGVSLRELRLDAITPATFAIEDL